MNTMTLKMVFPFAMYDLFDQKDIKIPKDLYLVSAKCEDINIFQGININKVVGLPVTADMKIT